ncbi:MAG: MraY family glycosyltransferase [bacterium]
MTIPLITFFSALVSTLIVTPLLIRWAHRLNLLDQPDERKIHGRPTPYLGGVALYLALAVTFLVVAMSDPALFLNPRPFEGFLVGATLVVLVGLLDDVWGLRPIVKLLCQMGIGLLMYAYGFRIDLFNTPFGDVVDLHTIGPLVTAFWFVLLMNSLNLIDGLDGLASGIGFISALTIFVISSDWLSAFPLLLALGFMGVTLGFLFFNFFPARCFLGDNGSLLLGFALATLTLESSTKSPALLTLLVPMVAVGVPIVDAVFAFFRRLFTGRHPFVADRRHLHHRLLALGLSPRRVVLVLYYISAFLGVMAYLLSNTSPAGMIATFLLLGLGFLLIVENLKYLERRGRNHDSH